MRQITPAIDDYIAADAPFYLPVGGEVEVFEHAYQQQIPVLLKGPTGCGKTRFVAAMAHRLGRPLVTVACHEDLSASDLIGRYLIQGDETVWVDGPLTTAVRHGAILYLDEIVEARKDTMVVIHPLTDHRRVLPIDKLAAVLKAPPEFMLVVSYNPGYQSVLKDLKPSTRQRFISLEFDYPPAEIEVKVVAAEAQVDESMSEKLVQIGQKVRNLTDRGLAEGASTRLLVYAGRLIAAGSSPHTACEAALSQTLTDDPDLAASIRLVVGDFF
jgi:nitric oxide reductase NorQ protein